MRAVMLGFVLGMALLAYVCAYAQIGATVPDWVVRYAGILQQRVTECEQKLAQTEDKSDKLAKDLATARAAAAEKK